MGLRGDHHTITFDTAQRRPIWRCQVSGGVRIDETGKQAGSQHHAGLETAMFKWMGCLFHGILATMLCQGVDARLGRPKSVTFFFHFFFI